MANDVWDVIIAGGGTGGLVAAIFASKRGARALVLEASDQLGGTLNISSGQLSAAGTRLQASKGIADNADAHYEDVVRISKGTADPALTRLAVDNAAATIDWLQDIGVEFLPEHPVLGSGHEFYSAKRYYWGENFGKTILESVIPAFQKEVDNGNVELLLNTKVVDLIQDEPTGEVTGVVAELPNGEERQFLGKNTVLATGGYNANPELYRELIGFPSYAGMSYPSNQGIAIKLGLKAGGWVRGAENFLTSFGNVLDRFGENAPLLARPIQDPQQRPPWEIYVNELGQRFIAEDEPSVDKREEALLAQPGHRRFIIFDDQILEQAPSCILNWSTEDLRLKFNNHPMFIQANDLRSLAEASGIDPDGLVKSVQEYNENLEGTDPLGRKYRPAPIIEAPFYAIRAQGTSVTSSAGIAVNDDLSVITEDSAPIPGLYALGEVLGSGQLMGRSFCGGMMATPAMTFGRLLGDSILKW